MRPLLLAGTSLLALSAAAASAAPITFGATPGLQTYTVPSTGLYAIVADGAQDGSNGGGEFGAPIAPGGRGAYATGAFTLTAGEMLSIDVGGIGGAARPNNGLSALRDVETAAREHTVMAIATLVRIAADTSAQPAAQVAAANALLDRRHGRPRQAMEISGSDKQPIELNVSVRSPMQRIAEYRARRMLTAEPGAVHE